MAINPGKRFEQNFQNSVDKETIFFHRLKDGSTRTAPDGSQVRLKNKNVCDFILFLENRLVLVELKSFLGKSMSFKNIKQKKEDQEEFLKKLIFESRKENVEAYMILNFRNYEKTLAIEINTFYEYYTNTTRESIDIEKAFELGFLIPETKKQVNSVYEIEVLFKEIKETPVYKLI